MATIIDDVAEGLAHLLCEAAHPAFQRQCTGWLRPDGRFVVSCAGHKMVANEMLSAAIDVERNAFDE